MSRIRVIVEIPTDQITETGRIIHDSIIFDTEKGEVFTCKGGRSSIKLPLNKYGCDGYISITVPLPDYLYDAIDCEEKT